MKKTCSKCGGTGIIRKTSYIDREVYEYECPDCKGIGKIDEDVPIGEEPIKRCLICGKKECKTCSYCGDYFCNSHLKPEAHKCPIVIPPDESKPILSLPKILILIFILGMIGVVYFFGLPSELPVIPPLKQPQPEWHEYTHSYWVEGKDTGQVTGKAALEAYKRGDVKEPPAEPPPYKPPAPPPPQQEELQSIREINLSLLEKEIHKQINREREKKGLVPLIWNDKLANIARNHSQDMAKRNYFEHDSPEGYDFSYRYKQGGFLCELLEDSGYFILTGGENLFMVDWWTIQDWIRYNAVDVEEDLIAIKVARGWMDSPGHKENILTREWRRQGIGVAISSNDEVYITENFC